MNVVIVELPKVEAESIPPDSVCSSGWKRGKFIQYTDRVPHSSSYMCTQEEAAADLCSQCVLPLPIPQYDCLVQLENS